MTSENIELPIGKIKVLADKRMVDVGNACQPARVKIIHYKNPEGSKGTMGWRTANRILEAIDARIKRDKLSISHPPVYRSDKNGQREDGGGFITVETIDYSHRFKYMTSGNAWFPEGLIDEAYGTLTVTRPTIDMTRKFIEIFVRRVSIDDPETVLYEDLEIDFDTSECNV